MLYNANNAVNVCNVRAQQNADNFHKLLMLEMTDFNVYALFVSLQNTTHEEQKKPVSALEVGCTQLKGRQDQQRRLQGGHDYEYGLDRDTQGCEQRPPSFDQQPHEYG